MLEIRDGIWKRCRGGAHPLVIVPVDTEPEVLHVRLEGAMPEARPFLNKWVLDLPMKESGFGPVGE